MVNNTIQPLSTGFWKNKKKPLKFSDFVIVGSNSLQLITFYHFPMQNLWLLSKIGCNSLLHIGLFATNERHFDVRVTDG